VEIYQGKDIGKRKAKSIAHVLKNYELVLGFYCNDSLRRKISEKIGLFENYLNGVISERKKRFKAIYGRVKNFFRKHYKKMIVGAGVAGAYALGTVVYENFDSLKHYVINTSISTLIFTASFGVVETVDAIEKAANIKNTSRR
jgi:hypothetical protein